MKFKSLKTVHEELEYSCGQCDHQATLKGSLGQHKREVHEKWKYWCGQCDHMATSKVSSCVTQKKTAHEGLK